MVRGELAPLLRAAGSRKAELCRRSRGVTLLLPAAKPCLWAHCTGQCRGSSTAAQSRVTGLPLVLHGYWDADF